MMNHYRNDSTTNFMKNTDLCMSNLISIYYGMAEKMITISQPSQDGQKVI